MSLFSALGLMGGTGGFEEDPFFGSASGMMRQMDSMMSSMMRSPFGGDPFGSMMSGPMMGMMRQPQQQQYHLPVMGSHMNNMNSLSLMANPMSMMNNLMANMEHVQGESNTQVFSSSSVMSMTMGPDGKPQVYQESSTVRGGPGGVRETQRSVVDTSSGTRKLAIGHHIGERARIVEREQNRDGEEENEELLNLDESEADEFEREFRRVASSGVQRRAAIESGRVGGSRRAVTPLAIEAPPATATSRPGTDRHVDFSETRGHDTSDRYNLERVPIGRKSGIDVSNFDRRPSDRLSGERFEYHRPNTSYTPAPTSYTRPSSYMPSVSSRSYRTSGLGRPLSSYSGRHYNSGREGRGAHPSRSHRRAGPYDQ
ncbi:myeloid leukemia factor 2 isoform X2 [Hyalella azteca]|uniref:Myeloid leukemia factor 2 isoform X2 n=1 Tax=Hyalella azteca TaxID=294128 RepID=A0A8B7MYB2_HYAAZ|nr:myeloid leukemia factor 2 isoform X2 [Hyalella azteca]